MRNLLIALLFAATASAQTLEQIALIRFDEQPMSARTAAMGGASDALGSDGTELALNPALIASLKKPVFALSGVESTFDISRFEFDGQGIVRVRETHSQTAFAHASAVIPWRGAVFGLYARNEPRAGYLTLSDGSEGTGEYVPICSGDDCEYAIVIGQSPWERRERRYGLTAAFERGAFSFGAGAELQQLDETYELMRADPEPFSPTFERIVRATSDSDVVFNAGIRWRVGPRLALAAAYNGAASHEQTEDVCTVGFFPGFACQSRVVRLGTLDAGGADALRASISMMPIDSLTVTAEAVRRNYSELEAQEVAYIGEVEYRDATDIHAGAEFRVPRVPLSLRAGWQRKNPKYDGFTFYGPREEAVEYATYGAGLEFRGARLDLAYDDADSPAFRRAIVAVSFTMN